MDSDLTVLQERCRKDPQSYLAEYTAQQNHYLSLLAAASLRPADASTRLPDVASFIASTSPLYGATAAAAVVAPTAALLAAAASELQPAARRALVRTLALMRGRGAADAKLVIPLFFRLLGCEDKVMRRMVHGHILADVRRMQASGDAGRRSLQAFLFGMVAEPNQVLVKRSLHVLVDLFRKRVWNDVRTANVIASCVFHEAAPVALIAAKFLLDSESKSGDDDDEVSDADDDHANQELDDPDDTERQYSKKGHDGRKASDMWKAYHLTGKKSSKKKRAMERKIGRATRIKRNPGGDHTGDQHQSSPSFAAMMLLNDPQSFAERLYTDLQTRRRNEPYENRLVLINLLTRLVGTYKLIVLNLYPFLQRYLQPAQPEVTRVLAYLAQGCHNLVPPDVLYPVLRSLADNFVSDRCSPPSMAAGINTIRAVCARVPLAIFDSENEAKPDNEQEAPLLEDLVEYKNNRDKGVVMAARSLIMLYRDVNPRLLRKRDRGRAAAEAVQKGTLGPAPAYGQVNFATGVDGAELLQDSSESESKGDEQAGDMEGESIASDDDELDEVNSNGSEDGLEANDELEAVNGGDRDMESESQNLARSPESGLDNDQAEVGQEGEDGAHEANITGLSKLEEHDGHVVESKSDRTQNADGARQDVLRVLTDLDFKRIRARTAARLVQGAPKRKTASGVIADTGDAVDPMDIQGIVKRERKNLEERMESVLAGREGREKYKSKKGSKKGGGSTNKAKLKTKTNSMVIHKQRRKSKMSRQEKQQRKTKKRVYK
jgi:protein SDA1